MAVLRTWVSLVAAAMLIQLSMAANHTVGGPNGGWDTATDLKTWATSQKFALGDSLIFQYLPGHDVSEVSQIDYDTCQGSNAVQTYNDGNTEILLSSPGKRYFICGVPGHCLAGMKVEIDTLATASPAPASPLTPPQASPVAPAPQVSPSTPPPTASPAPEATSPSPSPSPYPASPAPESSSPSHAESPTAAPTLSSVLSSSPLSSPPLSPDAPAEDSPSASVPPIGATSPPQPSSAVKSVLKATLGMGFSFGIVVLLAF